MNHYDLFILGNISIDFIKTPNSLTEMTGGAVFYAAWVAYQLGYKIGILTKSSLHDKYRLDVFPPNHSDLFWQESTQTTSIFNDYTTPDMEQRICTNRGQADAYKISDFPEFTAEVVQYSGLITGEIDLNIIQFLSKKGKLAIDAQGLTRKVMPDKAMKFQNWEEMREAMPFIYYFKADAAEAGFLTGIDTGTHHGRILAGRKFLELGVREAVISHNTELTVVTHDQEISVPFRNRNLSGRTGRGDTCFTAYITERFKEQPQTAIKFSAAVTSMKMEQSGPFKQTRQDVEKYINQFYL